MLFIAYEKLSDFNLKLESVQDKLESAKQLELSELKSAKQLELSAKQLELSELESAKQLELSELKAAKQLELSAKQLELLGKDITIKGLQQTIKDINSKDPNRSGRGLIGSCSAFAAFNAF